MKELIDWLIAEIDGGCGTATLRMKLEMLQKIESVCPSYYMPDIIKALGGEEDA